VPLAPGARAATTWQVSIVNYDFQPDSLEIMPGDTVVWTNDGTVTHDVTESGGAWTSGSLLPDETFTKTFDTIDVVNYYCSIHPTMTGTVSVGTEIPEFSSTFLVVLGMMGLLIGVVVIRKKH
jgi:plastocyanin